MPEDSLNSWNADKGYAAEVVNILWVLKKKYNELRELQWLRRGACGRVAG